MLIIVYCTGAGALSTQTLEESLPWSHQCLTEQEKPWKERGDVSSGYFHITILIVSKGTFTLSSAWSEISDLVSAWKHPRALLCRDPRTKPGSKKASLVRCWATTLVWEGWQSDVAFTSTSKASLWSFGRRAMTHFAFSDKHTSSGVAEAYRWAALE